MGKRISGSKHAGKAGGGPCPGPNPRDSGGRSCTAPRRAAAAVDGRGGAFDGSGLPPCCSELLPRKASLSGGSPPHVHAMMLPEACTPSGGTRDAIRTCLQVACHGGEGGKQIEGQGYRGPPHLNLNASAHYCQVQGVYFLMMAFSEKIGTIIRRTSPTQLSGGGKGT